MTKRFLSTLLVIQFMLSSTVVVAQSPLYFKQDDKQKLISNCYSIASTSDPTMKRNSYISFMRNNNEFYESVKTASFSSSANIGLTVRKELDYRGKVNPLLLENNIVSALNYSDNFGTDRLKKINPSAGVRIGLGNGSIINPNVGGPLLNKNFQGSSPGFASPLDQKIKYNPTSFDTEYQELNRYAEYLMKDPSLCSSAISNMDRTKSGFNTGSNLDNYNNIKEKSKQDYNRVVDAFNNKSCDELESANTVCKTNPDQKESLNSLKDIVNYSVNNSISTYSDLETGVVHVGKFCECRTKDAPKSANFQREKKEFEDNLKKELYKWRLYTHVQRYKSLRENMLYFQVTDVSFQEHAKKYSCFQKDPFAEIKKKCPEKIEIIKKTFKELEGIESNSTPQELLNESINNAITYEQAPFCQGDKKFSRVEYDLLREDFSKVNPELQLFSEVFNDLMQSNSINEIINDKFTSNSDNKQSKMSNLSYKVLRKDPTLLDQLELKLKKVYNNPNFPESIKKAINLEEIFKPKPFRNSNSKAIEITSVVAMLYSVARIDDPKYDLLLNNPEEMKKLNLKISQSEDYKNISTESSYVDKYFQDKNHYEAFNKQCEKLGEELTIISCGDIDLDKYVPKSKLIKEIYTGDQESEHFKNFICENEHDHEIANEQRSIETIIHPSQLSLSQTPDNYFILRPESISNEFGRRGLGQYVTNRRFDSALTKICSNSEVRDDFYQKSKHLIKTKLFDNKSLLSKKTKEDYYNIVTSSENATVGGNGFISSSNFNNNGNFNNSLISTAYEHDRNLAQNQAEIEARITRTENRSLMQDRTKALIDQDIDNMNNDKHSNTVHSTDITGINLFDQSSYSEAKKLIDEAATKNEISFKKESVNRTPASVIAKKDDEDQAVNNILNRYADKEITKPELSNNDNKELFSSLLDKINGKDVSNTNEDKLLSEINDLKSMLTKRESELDELRDKITDKDKKVVTTNTDIKPKNLDNAPLAFGSSTKEIGKEESKSDLPTNQNDVKGSTTNVGQFGSIGTNYANINQTGLTAKPGVIGGDDSKRISLTGVNFDNYDLNNSVVLNEVKTIVNRLYVEAPERVLEAYKDGMIEVELADGKKVKIDPYRIFTKAQVDELKKKQQDYLVLKEKEISVKEMRSKLYSKLILLSAKLKENGRLQ